MKWGRKAPFFNARFAKMTSKLISVALIGLAFLGLYLFFPNPDSVPAPKPSKQAQLQTDNVDVSEEKLVEDPLAEDVDEAQALAEQMKILPESLKDVPRPRSLDVDDAGNLILNGKIRILFDYYLSALGEEDLELIRQRVDYGLRDLPKAARWEALGIFDNYVAYLGAIDQLSQSHSGAPLSPADNEAVIDVKEQVLALRQQYFTPEVANVFFAKDDAWDNYVIQKLKITTDALLSETEKREAVADLDVLLPPEILVQKQQSDRINNYREQVDRASNAVDVQSIRTQTFSSEAVTRLGALDNERAQWDGRVSAYRLERDGALEFADPGSEAYKSAIDDIRSRHFSGAELQRIAALDEIEKLDRTDDD